MSKISAKIIADSRNEFGQRLTTFVLTFPRIVLAEFNTHRVFSRNSASSRAIPFKKMLKLAEEEPFIPIKWMKEHSGMQGTEFFSGVCSDDFKEVDRCFQYDEYKSKKSSEFLEDEWLKARDNAVESAKSLSNIGVTKQVCNRLLEPFMWHTVIVTASEWENFFALRAHQAAEIHIQELAYRMLEQYNLHQPKLLKAGEWHIPFGDTFDEERLMNDTRDEMFPNNTELQLVIAEQKVKVATARCARVSYLNFEGKDDYEADIKLHDTLLASGHMSPFEHCAKAMNGDEINQYSLWHPEYIEYGINGNFKGFIQYRKMLQEENKHDNRVKR